MIGRTWTVVTAVLGVALAVVFVAFELSRTSHLAIVPLYTLFLLLATISLTGRTRWTWTLMIPTFVGIFGDVISTATPFTAGTWLKNFGFAAAASGYALMSYFTPKRRWDVVLSGLSPLPLAIAWSFSPELFTTALTGSLSGFWLTFVGVTAKQAVATTRGSGGPDSVARKTAITAILVIMFAVGARAQELEPRAYGIAPIGTTVALVNVGGSKGGILFDPAVDVSDVEADLKILTTGFGYTFGLAGRQARVLALFPAAFGNITGNVGDQPQRQDLRGFADPRFRFSIGLRGASARSASEIAEATRVSTRSAMGVAVTVMPPLGQYNNREQVASLGYNRWAFKPEIGLTQTIDHWIFDGMAGVWLFTDNREYSPASRTKEQSAVVSFQGHVSYALPHRMWAALNGAFFSGGQTRVDGVRNPDRQENTRLGATFSLPLGRMHSLKFAYSTGLATLRGTDFDSLSITWQVVRFRTTSP